MDAIRPVMDSGKIRALSRPWRNVESEVSAAACEPDNEQVGNNRQPASAANREARSISARLHHSGC